MMNSIVFASVNNNLPDFLKDTQKNNGSIEEKSWSNFFDFSTSLESWMGPVYNIGINILIILFVGAIIMMAFAIITKTGHWMKVGMGTMIFSFISLLILRVGPILFLTTSVVGFTLIVSDSVHLLQSIALWTAIGMVLIGLFFRLLHRVVSQHPEYFRWSKSLLVSATILGLLSGVIPLLFRVV